MPSSCNSAQSFVQEPAQHTREKDVQVAESGVKKSHTIVNTKIATKYEDKIERHVAAAHAVRSSDCCLTVMQTHA